MQESKSYNYLSKLELILIEFGLLWRLVGVMNLKILSHTFNIQDREPFLCDLVKKKKPINLCSDI